MDCSRTLSQLVGAKLTVAKADHKARWLCTPEIELTEKDFNVLMSGSAAGQSKSCSFCKCAVDLSAGVFGGVISSKV